MHNLISLFKFNAHIPFCTSILLAYVRYNKVSLSMAMRTVAHRRTGAPCEEDRDAY